MFRWIIRTMQRGLPSNNHLLLGAFLLSVGYHSTGVAPAGGNRQYTNPDQDNQPWFKHTDNNITVHPGDRAVLRCRVENLGTKTVTWKKEGAHYPLTIGFYTFTPDTRISLDYNQRTREWSLIIQAVTPEDEGSYQCLITTKQQKELFYGVKLNVLTVQVTGTEYVEKGNAIRLMCNATGKPDPPHNLEWYKDGVLLESNAETGVMITKKIETKVLVSMLVITKSDISDTADYICRSSNQDAGQIRVHILKVAASPIKRGTNRNSAPSSLHRGSSQYVIVCLSLLVWFLHTRRQHDS